MNRVKGVEVLGHLHGPTCLELLARIHAVFMRLSTAIKILAMVRNITYLNMTYNLIGGCRHQCDKHITINCSLDPEAKRFHTAAQGQICSDIGKMSVKSSYGCQKAATAFGKTIESVIDERPGWCIFYNNEVYWDVPGGGLSKPEAQEICFNDVEGIVI